MSRKIAGLTLEIGGEVTPLNKALSSVNKTSRDLKSELRDVERLLKLDPTNTDLLNQRQEILGKTVETTKDRLEKLKEAEKQAQEQFKRGEVSEEQYRALQREVIKTEKDLEKFEDRLKKTNPRLEEFGAKAKETGDKLKDVGDKLTKGVTVPLMAAGAGLVAVGTKFDDVYDNIRVGTGATGEALQELNEDFRQIAKQTPASLDDVGVAVADYNTRLGLSGVALQELSRQTLELARITGGDLGTTIEETSQAFQAFNVPADDYGQSLDFVFRVSQSTGIEITRLEQNMVKFSPTLKQLGLGFEESATLMGQLDKAGVDVEQTLAGLTRSIANMAKEGITDANEAIEILFNEIKNAPSDLEGTQAALEIFGNRAGPAMASAIREGKMEYQDLIAELRGSDETILGVADETKDFSERFIELKNNIMIALEPLGEQLFNAINDLIPLFQKAVDFISDLIQKFADMSPETQKVILVVVGVVAALGPLLTLVGTISAALPALAGAFTLLTGPVGIVIAVIGGLIAIGVALYKNWDTIKEACGKAWDWIVNKVKSSVESVKKWFGGMVEAGKELIKGIWKGISDSWTWLTGKLKEWCGNILNAIKGWFGIKSPSKYTAEFGRYLVQGIAEGITEDMSAEQAAEQKVKNVLDKFKELTTSIGLDSDISKARYDLWLAENADATEAEKLLREAEYLEEQHQKQAEAVSLAEMAYNDMVERTGETSEESKRLQKQLLEERKAFAELTNQIKEAAKARQDYNLSARTNLRIAQTSYGQYLNQNYDSLIRQGISADDIFAAARRVSGLDQAESAVKSVVVNQTITTTAATPSEMREATRDGVRLATKEAYA